MNCIILFYQIVQLFKWGSKYYNGGPNSIIEYGPLGPYSMGVHILSVIGPTVYNPIDSYYLLLSRITMILPMNL